VGSWPLTPPPVAATPELRWALARAFAAEGEPPPPPADGERAVATAITHDLAVRIAARTPFERLRGEVGEAAAKTLVTHQLAVEGWGERVLAVAGEVRRWLEEAGVPVVLLKFAALRCAGHVPAGGRAASDLDVLVPATCAATARRALLASGCREERLLRVPHHLFPFLTPRGVPVEVHTRLPGVALPGAADATFEALEGAGLLTREGGAEGWLLPARELLVAHCLVHGLVQHGTAPLSYPPMRMVADLVDLGVGTPGDQALMSAVASLVGGRLPPEALAAVGELCRVLRAGTAAHLLAGADDGAARLLRHALAGPVDRRYQQALRWRAILGVAGEPRTVGGWLRELGQALWLTPGQVEVMHGPQRSAWGVAFWRLVRPLELLLRLPRYAWGAVRHRWGRRLRG